MEHSEISFKEVELYRFFKAHAGRWMTNKEIAAEMGRTADSVRFYTNKFRKLNIIDVAELHPDHRFRWSEVAEKRNVGYCLRLQGADEVFSSLEQPQSPEIRLVK
jgi:hypothetical protein